MALQSTRLPATRFKFGLKLKLPPYAPTTLTVNNYDENHIGDTVSIRRPPRVATDGQGRTVWMGQVTPSELRLEAAGPSSPYESAPEIGWPSSLPT